MEDFLRRAGRAYIFGTALPDTSINIPDGSKEELLRGGAMGVRFAIEDWAACAPGLTAAAEWLAWARAPWAPQGALEAKPEEMPALQRRRLNPLGRAVAHSAWRCHTPDAATPVVLASGHGDAQRCLQLPKEFA